MAFWTKIKNTLFEYRDLTKVGSANILVTMISAIFWFYVAAIVDVNDYGEISYHIAIATIASTAASIGVLNTLTVYTAKGVKIQNPLFFVALIANVITSVIVFFILHSYSTSLYVVGYVIFNLLTSEAMGRKLYGTFSKYLIIQRVLTVLFSISLYYLLGPEGIVLGIALSFFAYAHRIFIVLKQSKINLSLLKPYREFMMNSFGYDISRTLVIYIDKLVISPFFGFIILGHYQFAVQVVSVGIILPGTVFQYIVPQESSGRSVQNLKRMGIILSICIAIITIILAPLILPVLFHKYSDSIGMIQIMILSIIPTTITLMYTSKFLAREKNRIIVIGSLIFIFIQVASILILGKIFGNYGIASSIVLAYVSESVFLFILDKKTRWLDE